MVQRLECIVCTLTCWPVLFRSLNTPNFRMWILSCTLFSWGNQHVENSFKFARTAITVIICWNYNTVLNMTYATKASKWNNKVWSDETSPSGFIINIKGTWAPVAELNEQASEEVTIGIHTCIPLLGTWWTLSAKKTFGCSLNHRSQWSWCVHWIGIFIPLEVSLKVWTNESHTRTN